MQICSKTCLLIIIISPTQAESKSASKSTAIVMYNSCTSNSCTVDMPNGHKKGLLLSGLPERFAHCTNAIHVYRLLVL